MTIMIVSGCSGEKRRSRLSRLQARLERLILRSNQAHDVFLRTARIGLSDSLVAVFDEGLVLRGTRRGGGGGVARRRLNLPERRPAGSAAVFARID